MEPYSDSAPYIKITEQPKKYIRFRYVKEGRNGGTVVGSSSTMEQKRYVGIQLINYTGRAIVVVSCVSAEGPKHKPHPHNLVGSDGCNRGICSLEFSDPGMNMEFKRLGIQCVRKNQVVDSLLKRKEINVDPYGTGFDHSSQLNAIRLRAVRLCFKVYLENTIERGRFNNRTVPPVVTEIIQDVRNLKILKLSHCNSLAVGGQEIILLCEKVVHDDICIRFYDETWTISCFLQRNQVHKNVAITFQTPPYCNILIENPVSVKVLLHRMSDDATSEPLNFEYLPSYMNPRIAKLPRVNCTELTNLEMSLNDIAQPSTSRAGQQGSIVQQEIVWTPSSIFNPTIPTSVVDRTSNDSPMNTDEFISLYDRDPDDSFADIK